MPNNNRTMTQLLEAVVSEMQLDPGLLSEAERKTFLNDCLRDLGSITLFEKEVTLDVVSGVATLPDDFTGIVYLKWDGRFLNPIQTDVLSTTGNSPVGYLLTYSDIQLYPTPTGSGELKLYYTYAPGKLVNAEDQPDVPNGYDRLLVDYAVARGHRKNGNIGLYREYMSAYEADKSKLTLELIKRVNSRVTQTINQTYKAVPETPFDYL